VATQLYKFVSFYFVEIKKSKSQQLKIPSRLKWEKIKKTYVEFTFTKNVVNEE